MICNLSICTSDESFTAIPIFESCTSTLLTFTNDCSPIEKALSLQVSKTASVILTLLAEISTQSFNEFSILIFFMFKSEKSMSILICITVNDDKVSLVVGLTKDLIEQYDARVLIKSSFEFLGSKGGGGRVDFAQAGGDKKNNINQAFLAIKNKI